MHELHNHPMLEKKEGISDNKVIVDIEFIGLFSYVCKYLDDNHILVLRKEYDEIKNIE